MNKIEKMNTYIFKTERLILRPWEESDAGSLYEYARDPDVGPVAGWPVHTSIENSKEIIKNVLSAPETYAVCLIENDKAIGSIGLISPQQSHTKIKYKEMELGYWIGKEYWGQWLIPEAVRRLQQHAFEDLGCRGLWCGYYEGNNKSRRAQEKCGFRYHHTEENKPCELMGDIRTEHFTYISRDEWKSGVIIRNLSDKEIPEALDLAWKVFKVYELPDYSYEGIEEFRKCLHDEEYLQGIEYYGVFLRDDLVGMLGIRKAECHICFCFVDGRYHRKGLGTRMFTRVFGDYKGNMITVNSSPYGVPFYISLGFMPTDEEQLVNGIRFIPMRKDV